MIGAGTLADMAVGIDLWDVARSVRAGGAVLCERRLLSMAEQLSASDASGQVEVVVPPRLTGPAPDDQALMAVAAAFWAVFSGTGAERDAALLGAAEVGPVLEEARTRYAQMDPQLVVNRVRFPEPDRAEVRFRFLLNGGPGGLGGQGEAVRRDGAWFVTRETVLGVVPGGVVSRATAHYGLLRSQGDEPKDGRPSS